MTKQEIENYTNQMRDIKNNIDDPEKAHFKADALIGLILSELGFADIVEIYDDIITKKDD